MWGIEKIYHEVVFRVREVIGNGASFYPINASPENIKRASKIIQDFAQEIGVHTDDIQIVTHTKEGEVIGDVVSIAKRIWLLHYHNQSISIKTQRKNKLRKRGRKMTIWEQYEWQHMDNDIPVRIVGSYGSKNGG